MRKAPCFALLIACVAFATTAEAKTRDKSWEFSALVGNVHNSSDVEVDNGTGYTARVGYNITAKVEAEVSFQRATTEMFGHDTQFTRAVLAITATFLADRETRTLPYVSAGLGTIQEKVYAFTEEVDGTPVRVLEAFDSAALLTIGLGGRTFFTESWAARYEVRYNHHEAFDEGQDEYEVNVGITWILGGQK